MRTSWNVSELRHGDAVCFTLFNLILEKVTMDTEVENKGSIFNKSTQILTDTDDTVIVERSIVELKETMKQLMKAAQVMRLDMQKTNYIKSKKQLILNYKNL